MRSFIIFLTILAYCQGLMAVPVAEQYQKILAETSANAANETATQFREICGKADTLKTLTASERNILAAEETVLDLCSLLLPSVAGKHNSRHRTGTIHIYRHPQPLWDGLRLVRPQRT